MIRRATNANVEALAELRFALWPDEPLAVRRAEAEAMIGRLHELVTGKLPEREAKALGSLRAFGGVSKFPLRVKCASLAWHTLHSALHGEGKTVSTEGEGPADSLLEGA